MAGCKHIRRMSTFYDGEVSEQEHQQLSAHIRGCPECAGELERLRSVSAFLASAQAPQMGPEALQRFHSVVDAARERVVFQMARSFAAAAAVVLVVSLVWLFQVIGAQDVHAQMVSGWERAAVLQQAETPGDLSAEAQFAQWIVEDLAGEDGSE